MIKEKKIIIILILITLFLLPQEKNFNFSSELDKQSTRYVGLTVIDPLSSSEKWKELIFRFQVFPPYHINSGNPLIEGLIPTVVTLRTLYGVILYPLKTTYPPDEILDISGFRTTVYFNGPHDLLLKMNPRMSEDTVINYTFHYQACKDDECYAPESISGNIAFQSNGKDRKKSLLSWDGLLTTEIFWVIIFAFLGGLILNVTPCVLPILSLKLLSLSSMKNTEEKAKKKLVAFHIWGALTFFLFMAIGVIALQAGGEELGWGFQFQSPHYIFFITLILGVVSLNLLGVYEIPFSYTTNTTHKKALGENLKHFSTGFLSVILATPCTVPFLGIAVAYSFSQSAAVIILLHLFIALGFTTPYALIFLGIDISRLIPQFRPIENYIKKILGFLVILTLFWLIDIYWTITANGIPLLGTLWLSALGLWIYGELQRLYPSIKWEWKFWGLAFVLWIILIFWLPGISDNEITNNFTDLATLEGKQPNSPDTIKNDDSIMWIPFDKQLLNEYLDKSEIVYVHFTADWCLNCKVNEKLILERKGVVKLFKKHEVIMMKADWTRSNKAIFNEIQSLGRAGIPLDVLYSGNRKIILNTILTVGEIKSSLEELTQQKGDSIY